jgi:hypothetical protein
MGSLPVQYDTVSVVSFVCVALLPRCTMMASYPDQARSSAMPVLCAWACRGRPRTPCDVRHGSPTSHTHAGEVPGANLCTAHGTTATATVRWYGTRIRDRHLCALPPIPPLSRPRGASMMRRERALAVGDGTSPQIIPSLISSTTQRNARTGTPPVSRGSLAVDR